jgi:hypothetical protein
MKVTCRNSECPRRGKPFVPQRASAQYCSTAVLGILRKQDRLDWDMVLDLTRDLDQWQTFGSPREARAHAPPV